MLRLFRHYIPLLLVGTVVCDMAVIAASVSLAFQVSTWAGEGALWPKAKGLQLHLDVVESADSLPGSSNPGVEH